MFLSFIWCYGFFNDVIPSFYLLVSLVPLLSVSRIDRESHQPNASALSVNGVGY